MARIGDVTAPAARKCTRGRRSRGDGEKACGDVRVRAAGGRGRDGRTLGLSTGLVLGKAGAGAVASSALGNETHCLGRGTAFLLHLTDCGLIHRASPGRFPFLAAGPLAPPL